jgi:hypothetical protein
MNILKSPGQKKNQKSKLKISSSESKEHIHGEPIAQAAGRLLLINENISFL